MPARDHYRALLIKIEDDNDAIIRHAPKEVEGSYEKMRDWLCKLYGPSLPLTEFVEHMRALENHQCSVFQLFECINHIRYKYRRAAKRLSQPEEMDPAIIMKVLIKKVGVNNTEGRWLIKQRAAGVEYEKVQEEAREMLTTLEQAQGDLLAPPVHYQRVDNPLQPSYLTTVVQQHNTINSPLYDTVRQECFAAGPMMIQKKQASGLMSDSKEGSNQNDSSNNQKEKTCFYCNQPGHFKDVCPVRKYHRSKGLILVREQNVKQSFDRAQNRSYDRPYGQRTFFINGARREDRFNNRRRPYGNLRFLRRKGLGGYGNNRYYNNDRNRYDYNRGPGNRPPRRPFNNRRGLFVVEGLYEADSADDEEKGEVSGEQEQMREEVGYVSDDVDRNEKREVDIDNLFIDERGHTYGIEELQDCVLAIEQEGHTDVETSEGRRKYDY